MDRPRERGQSGQDERGPNDWSVFPVRFGEMGLLSQIGVRSVKSMAPKRALLAQEVDRRVAGRASGMHGESKGRSQWPVIALEIPKCVVSSVRE
jgi:hypothetical protein